MVARSSGLRSVCATPTITGVRGSSAITGERRGGGLTTYSWEIDVLFLCTGNICRSPMAEALLRHRLGDQGVDAHVHSAGLRIVGEPASAHGVDVMADRGLDLTAHRSRTMNRELLEDADLVLGMAREH